MSQESQKTSIWTWLLPMMMGAFISLVTDQLSERQQEKAAKIEKRVEEGKTHFFKVSSLTGELYSTTIALLTELSEKESTEISTLVNEYNQVLTKLNIHELQFLSILEYHFGEKAAQHFEDEIVMPLRAYHETIDHCLITGKKISLSASDQDDLKRIKNNIVKFNQKFLAFIDGIK